MANVAAAELLGDVLSTQGLERIQLAAKGLLVKGSHIPCLGEGVYRTDMLEAACGALLEPEGKKHATSRTKKLDKGVMYAYITCVTCSKASFFFFFFSFLSPLTQSFPVPSQGEAPGGVFVLGDHQGEP